MRCKRWSFDTTFDFVRLRKSNVNPNFGFLQQLRSLEDELSRDSPLAHMDADGLRKMAEELFGKPTAGRELNGAASGDVSGHLPAGMTAGNHH